jgi:hypothetical protein
MALNAKPRKTLEAAASSVTKIVTVSASEATGMAASFTVVAGDLEAPGDIRQRSVALATELTNAPNQKIRDEVAGRALGFIETNI